MGILHQVGVAIGRVLRPQHAGEDKLVSSAPELAGVARLGVTSAAFSHGERIPSEHSRDGGNVSPPLAWRGVPPRAREIAVIVEDPDAPPPCPRAHWVIYGISPDTRVLPAKRSALGVQGVSSHGTEGYTGPHPAPGRAHRYHFQVFALDTKLGLPPRRPREDLAQAMQGHVIAWGKIVGTFQGT